MIFEESYTLHNGVAIPKLALGTWFIDDDKAAEAVRAAVDIGYRHVDTAQAYGNERGVGEGIRTCGIDRKDIFVTSKVAAENKSYAAAMESIDKTLETMGLAYLDMMIIHSPQPWVEVNQSEDRYYKENEDWLVDMDNLSGGVEDGEEVIISVRPEEFDMEPGTKEGIRGVIRSSVFLGLTTHYFITTGSGQELEILQTQEGQDILPDGSAVTLTVKAGRINVFRRATEETLIREEGL